jgi:hypothetical protein
MEQQTEVWETTTAGGVWIYRVNDRGVETPRRIKGKTGFRFKVTARDREASGARFYEAKQDPFLNGTFVRVDKSVEKILEDLPEYDVDQALTDGDLLKVLASSGNAFQAKVRKLNERNVRRLVVLAEENPDVVSSAQEKFLETHVAENYRPKVKDE